MSAIREHTGPPHCQDPTCTLPATARTAWAYCADHADAEPI